MQFALPSSLAPRSMLPAPRLAYNSMRCTWQRFRNRTAHAIFYEGTTPAILCTLWSNFNLAKLKGGIWQEWISFRGLYGNLLTFSSRTAGGLLRLKSKRPTYAI